MFSSPRRHPLHTFRFWFLMLGAVTVTVAWRLDLLPFELALLQESSPGEEEFVEVTLSEGPGGNQGTPVEDSNLSDSPFFTPDQSTTGQINPFASDPTGTHESALAVVDSTPAPHDRAPAGQEAASGTGGDGEWWDGSSSDHDSAGHPSDSTSPGPHVSEIVQVASRELTHTGSRTGSVAQALGTSAVPGFDFTKIDELMETSRSENEVEAHRELSRLYWQHPELRPQLQERIDRLARRIYFMPQPHYMDPYVVQPGDLLQKVAQNYNISWQYLAKLNRVNPQKVRTGQELKVIQGPFSVIVDLSDFEMTIHAHGYYVARFPVGVGKDGSTPVGEMTVQEKLMDPTYYGPDGVIAHDDPANPLGEHWIDIGNSFGIHGTIEPESIGKSQSRGCVRLLNEDVAVVYDLLTIGSAVQIRE